MMKAIELTQGQVALVDDSDFERLSCYQWCALRSRNTWYAVRKGHKPGSLIYMHIALLGRWHGMIVHHRNGDGLDNRRANLELVPAGEHLALHSRQRRMMAGI